MNNPHIKTIDVHQLKKIMEENTAAVLIDVRELEEWQQLHIPGALHVPKDCIRSTISQLAFGKNHPIYLHCKSGVRSLFAAQTLMEMGYDEVYSVNGGILDWAIAGYPIEHQLNPVEP